MGRTNEEDDEEMCKFFRQELQDLELNYSPWYSTTTIRDYPSPLGSTNEGREESQEHCSTSQCSTWKLSHIDQILLQLPSWKFDFDSILEEPSFDLCDRERGRLNSDDGIFDKCCMFDKCSDVLPIERELSPLDECSILGDTVWPPDFDRYRRIQDLKVERENRCWYRYESVFVRVDTFEKIDSSSIHQVIERGKVPPVNKQRRVHAAAASDKKRKGESGKCVGSGCGGDEERTKEKIVKKQKGYVEFAGDRELEVVLALPAQPQKKTKS